MTGTSHHPDIQKIEKIKLRKNSIYFHNWFQSVALTTATFCALFVSGLIKLGIDPEAYCFLCKKEFCSKYFLRTHKLNMHGMRSDGGESGPPQQRVVPKGTITPPTSVSPVSSISPAQQPTNNMTAAATVDSFQYKPKDAAQVILVSQLFLYRWIIANCHFLQNRIFQKQFIC